MASNQHAIAKALKLNQSTVSRALRDDPTIPLGTRRRVVRAAAKLGYVANPLVSTLMAHIRSGRPRRDHGCLALLVDACTQAEWMSYHAYRQQHEGIQRRAALRGYRTEVFLLRAAGMSGVVIDRILYRRGIAGVILTAPKYTLTPDVHLRWDRYAVASVAYNWHSPRVDGASTCHRHNIDRCFRELRGRGYRRIGMMMSEYCIEWADRNWTAGFLLNQCQVPARDRVPLFTIREGKDLLQRLRRWYERWKPDSVIGGSAKELNLLRQADIAPPAVAYAAFNRPPDADIAGVDENNIAVGEKVCDLVVTKIMHNERGLPEFPQTTLIDGIWHDGATLPRDREN